MVNTTNPDSMPRWEKPDPASLVQVSQSLGDAFQTALNKRQRFSFVWANSTERGAQTGMVESSLGYQIDTETEYIYNGSEWQSVVAHAEYTYSKSIPNTTVEDVGTLTLDAAASTSTKITTTSTTPDGGQVIFSYPGIYQYSAISTLAGGATGRAFMDLQTSATASTNWDDIIARHSVVVLEDIWTIQIGNLWINSKNSSTFLRVYHSQGGSTNVSGRIRVTRIG